MRAAKQAPSVNTRRGEPWTESAVSQALALVRHEFDRAGRDAEPFHSVHEGVAKIREEYLELEKEVFEMKRHMTDWEARLEEATHIAAVAVKFMVELCLPELGDDT